MQPARQRRGPEQLGLSLAKMLSRQYVVDREDPLWEVIQAVIVLLEEAIDPKSARRTGRKARLFEDVISAEETLMARGDDDSRQQRGGGNTDEL